MAKELFSLAALEYKESTRVIRQRKIVVITAWIFATVSIGYGIYLLKDFPLNISFHQWLLVRENQVTLIKAVLGFIMGLWAFAFSIFILQSSLWSFAMLFFLSLLTGGIIVYSDLTGFEIVRGRGLGAAYGLCIVLPILVIVLIIDQRRKSRQ